MDRDEAKILKDLNGVILGTSTGVVRLQISVLQSLGIGKLKLTNNVTDFCAEIYGTTPDFALLNDDGNELVFDTLRLIRDQEASPDPYLFCIVISSRTTKEFIRAAIHHGADEVVGLPFRASDFLRRFHFAAQKRRPFISIKNYFGPDRRRYHEDVGAKNERRKAAAS